MWVCMCAAHPPHMKRSMYFWTATKNFAATWASWGWWALGGYVSAMMNKASHTGFPHVDGFLDVFRGGSTLVGGIPKFVAQVNNGTHNSAQQPSLQPLGALKYLGR